MDFPSGVYFFHSPMPRPSLSYPDTVQCDDPVRVTVRDDTPMMEFDLSSQ